MEWKCEGADGERKAVEEEIKHLGGTLILGSLG